VRDKLRECTKIRYQFWTLLPNWDAAMSDYAKSVQLQQEIWSDAVAATKGDTEDARKLLLPALNDMIDCTTTRLILMEAHPPVLVFALLFVLSQVAAWTIGFGMGNCVKPSYLHAIGFAVVVAFALYVIFEIEYPRHGLVTLDATQNLLNQLNNEIK
jgi:hypothetical protein